MELNFAESFLTFASSTFTAQRSFVDPLHQKFVFLALALWTITFVLLVVLASFYFCSYLVNWILKKDDGTPEMRQISDAIREGAEGNDYINFG